MKTLIFRANDKGYYLLSVYYVPGTILDMGLFKHVFMHAWTGFSLGTIYSELDLLGWKHVNVQPYQIVLFFKVTVIIYTPTRKSKPSYWTTSSPSIGILIFPKLMGIKWYFGLDLHCSDY